MKNRINQSLKYAAAVMLAAWLMLGEARASVSLNLDIEVLFGANTLTLAPQNSTVVLLASTQNGTFGDLTLAASSFTVEADDVVLGIYPIAGTDGIFQNSAFLDIDTTTASSSGLSLNDPLLLVWYPNLAYSGSLTGPGNSSQLFGTLNTASAVPGLSDIGFVVPANGTYALNAFGTGIGGDLNDNLFVANQLTVVPEPSSIALVALGCVGMLVIRRRKLARA
ncbi:MAG: hypothetical protein PCFJNLEI_01412 [Verrucomicrobiae bacterium]|nr:hypothetical protein [Verrucomicrobiae bacterium]